MPYEISFTKRVESNDADEYINECCFGGDVVSDVLLPTIRERYEHVRANQEDWGWFIWFWRGPVSLAIDICCDDPATGDFRIHLISRVKRMLFMSRVVDTPALDELESTVVRLLTEWIGEPPRVAHLDHQFEATEDG
ncbi:MAG: hypothetical protein GY937_26885 [bacterium]|nr:hypothetical protein [bacterium]